MGFWVGKGAYLRSGWNVMDGFLVVISWVDVIVTLCTDEQSSILGVLRVFRALRTLRPLRYLDILGPLRYSSILGNPRAILR